VKHEDEKWQDGADPLDDQQPEDEDVAVSKRGLRAFFGKRWAFPALYLTAAVLIIALMYFQANRFTGISQNNVAAPASTGQSVNPAVPTASSVGWIWPVESSARTVTLVRGYYDAKSGTVASLQKDLVHFGNTYSGSTGVDFGNPDGKGTFNVVAAASGVVENIHNSPVMGESVSVNDGNGYSTVYESLGKVDVKVGETVAQGDVLGTSGTNMMEADLGNHLYFQVEKNGALVNPAAMLPKTIA